MAYLGLAVVCVEETQLLGVPAQAVKVGLRLQAAWALIVTAVHVVAVMRPPEMAPSGTEEREGGLLAAEEVAGK